MGIANAIAGYNENFKVRQLLGDNMAGEAIKKGMNMDEQRKSKGTTFRNVFKIAEE